MSTSDLRAAGPRTAASSPDATVALVATEASGQAKLRARGARFAFTSRGAGQLVPVAFTVLSALAFFLLRPGVNDLWAARARASAASDGVGLTYWFSWFGGGATPGNYSVVSPYLCAYLGTELVGALSAVAISVLVALLVRDLTHPSAAAAVGAVAVAANLWSGRVPFLLGSAIALGALLTLRARRRAVTIALTLLSILASPVSGAFIALGLSGTFLTTRTREWRPIIGQAVAAVALALIGVALAFGTPGPEPFPTLLAVEVVIGLALLWAARPPDHLRTTIVVAAVAAVALYVVPNGMGSNFARFAWFCLPVAVVATSARRATTLLFAVTPLLAVGCWQTVTDLRNAAKPVSSVAYYATLSKRLAHIPNLQNYRVEVVNHGAHAGYDALLPYATLARGWETQEDLSLNKALSADPLPPTTYKVWLDNNAVGYVALPTASVGHSPEYSLVRSARASYLRRIWRDSKWQLFAVRHPTSIVAPPARLAAHTQSTLTLDVPCACQVAVRVRWSKFLYASTLPPRPGARTTSATVRNDGFGWTQVITRRPGVYVLSGSLGGIVR